jgi:hypothetical protein
MDKPYTVARVNQTEPAHFGNTPDHRAGISVKINYPISRISINNFVKKLSDALHAGAISYDDMETVTLSQQERYETYFHYKKDSKEVLSKSEKKYVLIEIIGTFHGYGSGIEEMYKVFESAVAQSAYCLE